MFVFMLVSMFVSSFCFVNAIFLCLFVCHFICSCVVSMLVSIVLFCLFNVSIVWIFEHSKLKFEIVSYHKAWLRCWKTNIVFDVFNVETSKIDVETLIFKKQVWKSEKQHNFFLKMWTSKNNFELLKIIKNEFRRFEKLTILLIRSTG